MRIGAPNPQTLWRYIIVGIACVVLNNAILIGGENLGIHYVISAIICFIFVGGLAYLAHANFTFDSKNSWTGYFRFLGAQSLGLILTIILLYILSEQFSFPIWIAAPVTTITIFVYQFLSTRWAILANRA